MRHRVAINTSLQPSFNSGDARSTWGWVCDLQTILDFRRRIPCQTSTKRNRYTPRYNLGTLVRLRLVRLEPSAVLLRTKWSGFHYPLRRVIGNDYPSKHSSLNFACRYSHRSVDSIGDPIEETFDRQLIHALTWSDSSSDIVSTSRPGITDGWSEFIGISCCNLQNCCANCVILRRLSITVEPRAVSRISMDVCGCRDRGALHGLVKLPGCILASLVNPL